MAKTAASRRRDTRERQFPIVGIGASAGGLNALRAFFQSAPADSGMAFVVIVHLDPSHKSHMAELLQRHTEMRVRQVSKGMRLEPNEVYVIPPDKDITLTDGHFKLAARSIPNRNHAPIDGFFTTLANTHSSAAIGIVLSGTGSDGVQGIRWIKEKGGITMAQSPEEAEYRSMPENAIATGQVDIVLPAGQLAMEAFRIASAESGDVPTKSLASRSDEKQIDAILTSMRSVAGHDFSGYKRSTLERRIRRRSQFAKVSNLREYISILSEDRTELGRLYDDLLISVTGFFRDADAFDALEREIVPRLFEDRTSDNAIRVWICGCSTGEEAYSLAILMAEFAERLENPPSIQIFATDVHERGFALAREGLYPDSIASVVTPARLERFFTRVPGGYKIRKSIRENVIFAVHNVLKDPPFLRMDLISCRNLMIYIDREAQRRLLRLFHFALRPRGFLFLGNSESVDDVSRLFDIVNKKHRLFETKQSQPSRISQLAEAPHPRRTARRPEIDGTSASTMTEAHQKALEELAPPSLVVNREGEVIHLSDTVGRFLKLGPGRPTTMLLDMLPRPSRPRVRKALSEVFKSGRPSVSTSVIVNLGAEQREVTITVRALAGATAEDLSALVLFDEAARRVAVTNGAPGPRRKARTSMVNRDLEQELHEARTQLQLTTEEHEASIEELKASNEELQSINEEQKATEEELEASKEELQSINEEVQTINQEYRIKNEQLAETNADLINLINSTDIATIFLDRHLKVRRFTPAVSTVFNLLPTDVGRPLTDLTHRLDYPELHDDAGSVMASLTRVEREVKSSDGKWYTVRIAAYRSLDDRIDGVVLNLVDTTDRKIAEVDRETLLNEVQETSVAKSNFIGVMSHEFRTPLNAILGYADIIAAGAVGPISPEQCAHLDRIKASAAHLAHMIDDSLQSVRIEAGITSVDNQSVDIGELVREVAVLVEPLMTAKSLRFDVSTEDGPQIIADPTKIRQVLFNLLGNAVRYTDKGSVSMSSRVDDHGAAIIIEDTGIGISPENLEKIFERFWQVDQSRTRVRGGTGLGLMVSRSLTRLMGGELDVSSELGRGSRFIVRLPLNGPTAPTR